MTLKPVFGTMPFGKRDAKFLMVAFFDPYGIETIPQSIRAWQSLSRHEIVLLNLWPGRPDGMKLPKGLRLKAFDGIIIHPAVSCSPPVVETLDEHLDRGLAEFDGVKVLMKQDEQVLSGRLAPLVRSKGFDVVLTCLPPVEQEKVYPRSEIGSCTLLQVLTGYVSPEMRQGAGQSRRTIDLSYRGSIQPLEFGRLGYEKRGVGYDMTAMLERNAALNVDISSRWEDRLSGRTWRDFLAASHVVLGMESGANLFDFDGSVAAWCRDYARRHAGEDAAGYAYYQRAHEAYLHRFEDNVNYAQISPRHFEAAAAGAAQLLYDGEYSGIFTAGIHYFPLARGLGNRREVLDFLADRSAQRRMAEAAFEEIVLDRRNWYEHFVETADAVLDAKLEAKGLRKRNGGGGRHRDAGRPLAYVIAAHEPTVDPRIGWFSAALARTHRVVEIGTFRYGEVGDAPTLETVNDDLARVRVERTKHGGAWIPSARRLWDGASDVRGLLAELTAFAAAPRHVLAERLGADVSDASEFDRFRWFCRHMVNTSSALLNVMERLGAPDVIVAADLDALFAATIFGDENDCPVVYDAHEYWPYSVVDHQHWEIAFWQSIERRVCRKAALRFSVSPPLAAVMSEEYGCYFESLPNAVTIAQGQGFDLASVFARRLAAGPLRILYQGAFAPRRGLEQFIRAWARVRSDAQLLLRGPDNPYRQELIALARDLGLEGRSVFFPDPVTEDQLITTALDADIGLIPYHPGAFSHLYCSPNKFSQFSAAALPLIVSGTQFVGRMVADQGLGFVVDIDDPEAVARLVDDLQTRRVDLVEMGQRVRQFFETTFNWERLIEPYLAPIASLRRGSSAKNPDFSWIGRRCEPHIAPEAPALLSPELFGWMPTVTDPGEVDIAKAEWGAAIVGSSSFHSAPNDPQFLLEPEDPLGYAAAMGGTALPHWFEIDLGCVRLVHRLVIIWYSADRHASAYRILVRADVGDPWQLLIDVTGSRQVEVVNDFRSQMRFVRLETTAYEGDPRMLIRAFRLMVLRETATKVEPRRTSAQIAAPVAAEPVTAELSGEGSPPAESPAIEPVELSEKPIPVQEAGPALRARWRSGLRRRAGTLLRRLRV